MIKLRNLKAEDADGMLEWMHDPSTAACFRRNMLGMTREKVLEFIESNSCFQIDDESRHYAVVDENDTYIGTISLKNIDRTDKNAEYAVAMRNIARGKGVAKQATALLIKIAFEELALEKIYLNVLANNARAIRFYEKCGFCEEGTFKKHVSIGGKLVDLKWYGLLKEDLAKNVNE